MEIRSKVSEFWKNLQEYIKNNKKQSILIGGGIAVVLIAVIFLPILFGGSEDTTTTQIVSLSTGDLSQTIDVVGNVQAVPSAALDWGTSGTVEEIYFEVGDFVREGDVVASLADSSVDSSVLQAQSDLLEAQYELDRISTSDADFQAAAQVLEDAEYDYRSKEDMRDFWNFNNTDQEIVEEARTAYHDTDTIVWNLENEFNAMNDEDEGKEALNDKLQDAIFERDKALRNLNYLLGHSYDHTVETDYIEFEMAEAALQEARINYERYLDNSEEISAAQAKVQALENTVNSSKIIAPFDGVLTHIENYIGESVTNGSQAAQLDNLDNLVININVSEVDVNEIALGQTVNITFDALPGEIYKGSVTNVSQAGDDSSGIVEFMVTITMSDPGENIKPGFTAVASIVVNEVENAVLVPNMAIQSINGNSIVMVADEDGNAIPTPVTVEVSGDSYSVLAGSPLAEGDQVMIEIDMASLPQMMGGFGMLGGGGNGANRPKGPNQ